MGEFVVQLFIAAARQAALWPEPHRFLARDALWSLPPECYGSGSGCGRPVRGGGP